MAKDSLGVLRAVIESLLSIAGRSVQEAGGVSRYRDELRRPVRGYWSGSMDLVAFYDAMETAIRQGLTGAWREGAKIAGVNPDELTQVELDALEVAIRDEAAHIPDLAERIEANSKAAGGKLQPLFDRVEQLWVNRYNDVKNRAMQMANTDPKLRWDLGRTEKHCRDCLTYNRRVYRASTWNRYGIRPQAHGLACHGFRCDCRFTPAPDAALTKGRPPAMTG